MLLGRARRVKPGQSPLEPRYAARLPVVSAASAFRDAPDVPLILPQVNPGNTWIWSGCSSASARPRASSLPDPEPARPRAFRRLRAQAPRGCLRPFGRWRWPRCQARVGRRKPLRRGVAALDVIDNLVPYVPGEEEKVARETGKILGRLAGDRIEPHGVRVSCTCTRVAVLDGHTEVVFAALERPATLGALREALAEGSREWRRRSTSCRAHRRIGSRCTTIPIGRSPAAIATPGEE